MGRSGAERRRRRRALAAIRSHAPPHPNKFVLPPKEENRLGLEAAIADRGQRVHAKNRISKRRKGKKSAAEKLRRRIQSIVSVPDVSEVTIQWENGTTKSFKLPKDEDGGTPNGQKSENTISLFNEESDPVYSACGMRAEADPSDKRSPSIDSEVPEAQKTTSDLPARTIGSKSPVAIFSETQLGDISPTQLLLSRRPSDSPLETANPQPSKDSFHDSQEYPDLEGRSETVCCSRGTQTTPGARRVSSAEIPLGHSPESNRPSRDEEADQNISWRPVFEEYLPQPPEPCQGTENIAPSSPPSRKPAGSSTAEHGISDACSEASQELPALHPRLEQPPLTMQLTTSHESPRKKRTYDPYEITPTPPKKRVLRSSGKLFATPPWKIKPEQKSQSTPGAMKTSTRRRSGLLRGKPVVSEAELVSIFSDPDPDFDHFGGDVLKSDIAVASTNDDGALAETNKGNVKKVKDETPIMPPRNRAVREWKEDKGELSDDSSYTGMMSTPLRNYGRTPRITSQLRPGLISVEKRTPARRTTMWSKSSSRSRRSVSKDAAERIAELPTSPTADSMASSPGSKASTKPTSPMEEAVSKPIGTAKPELKPRRISMSLVPGIPLSRQRRGSKSTPGTSHCFSNMTPSAAKETPPRATGIRSPWASGSSDPVQDMVQWSRKTPTEHVPAKIEIPAPTFNSLESQSSGSSLRKARVKKEKREDNTNGKIEKKADAKKGMNEEAGKTPKAEENTSKKTNDDAKKGGKPGKDWVAPEKRTPVPLPPYVAMMRR